MSNFQRFYGNMIWTNHAIERLFKRNILQTDAFKVINNPDKTFPGKKPDTVKFIRRLNERSIHLVAKLNEDKQWVVLTAWVRGEEDQYGFPERFVYKFISWLVRSLYRLVKFIYKQIASKFA